MYMKHIIYEINYFQVRIINLKFFRLILISFACFIAHMLLFVLIKMFDMPLLGNVNCVTDKTINPCKIELSHMHTVLR